jgi:hypothetical protein
MDMVEGKASAQRGGATQISFVLKMVFFACLAQKVGQFVIY